MTTTAQTMVNTAFSGDYAGALKLCAQSYPQPEADYDASFISGYCHFHLNDPDSATQHFQSALRLRPADPYAWYYIAVTKYKAAQKADALRDVTHALNIWAAHPESGEFKGLIQTGIQAFDDLSDDPSADPVRAEFSAFIGQLHDLPFELQLDVFLCRGDIDKARKLASDAQSKQEHFVAVTTVMDVDAVVRSGQGRFLYQDSCADIAFEKIAADSTTTAIAVPANPAYVAEVYNVSVTGVSSAVFGPSGEVISDTYSHPLYGKYVDLRADEKIISRKGDLAVIRSETAGKHIARAINLVGLASNHFGHWFSEYLPRLRHFMQLEDFEDIPLLVNSDMPASHYTFLSYLCPNPLIKVDRDELVQVDQLLVAPTITFYPFDLIPTHKVPPEHQASWSAPAMSFMRTRILDAIHTDTGPGRSIYLSRKNSSWGKPTNEAEFEQRLLAQSVEIICLEDLSFEEQVQTIHSADVIIAPTGSALNMAMFAQTGARIFVFSQKEAHNWGGWLGPMKGIGFNPRFLMMQEGSTLGKHTPFAMDIEALNLALKAD